MVHLIFSRSIIMHLQKDVSFSWAQKRESQQVGNTSRGISQTTINAVKHRDSPLLTLLMRQPFRNCTGPYRFVVRTEKSETLALHLFHYDFTPKSPTISMPRLKQSVYAFLSEIVFLILLVLPRNLVEKKQKSYSPNMVKVLKYVCCKVLLHNRLTT